MRLNLHSYWKLLLLYQWNRNKLVRVPTYIKVSYSGRPHWQLCYHRILAITIYRTPSTSVRVTQLTAAYYSCWVIKTKSMLTRLKTNGPNVWFSHHKTNLYVCWYSRTSTSKFWRQGKVGSTVRCISALHFYLQFSICCPRFPWLYKGIFSHHHWLAISFHGGSVGSLSGRLERAPVARDTTT